LLLSDRPPRDAVETALREIRSVSPKR
jgi:hypothetical protein